MTDFDMLLSQGTVSGEELGRLIIRHDIALYRKQTGLSDDNTEDGLTQEILDTLTGKIAAQEDAEILEGYTQLQYFVQYAQAMSYAYNQQAQNGFCRLLMYMSQAQQVEHARSMLELLPMIMTEKQFRNMTAPDPLARRRGAAIVANSFPCRPKCLDLNDNFIQPEIDCFQEMMSLEHAGEIAEKLEYFRNDLLLGGLKCQTAYNTLFSLISERINLPEFTVFCTDTEDLLRQIADFNRQQEQFRTELAGDGAEYEIKQQILHDVFRTISPEAMLPSEQAVCQVREELSRMSIFRTSELHRMISVLLENGGIT